VWRLYRPIRSLFPVTYDSGRSLSHPEIQISKIYQDNAFTKNLLGLHGMAYYIFLKSLRSLEEFRKIPTSKFLLNLLVQIFKALVNSKIQLLLRKGFLFRFGPAARRCIWPFSPAGLTGYTRPSCSPSLPPAETSAATGPVSHRLASTAQAATATLPLSASPPPPPLLLGHYYPFKSCHNPP
jgi:hypothetical protein